MSDKKTQPPKFTYIKRKKPFTFPYLFDDSTRCCLCAFLGREESRHSYLDCPVCFEENLQYEKKQGLQDFLYGEMPPEQRGYTMDVHAKVRMIEALIGAKKMSYDEGVSILADLSKTLQYQYKTWKEQQQRSPSEEEKRAVEYRLF